MGFFIIKWDLGHQINYLPGIVHLILIEKSHCDYFTSLYSFNQNCISSFTDLSSSLSPFSSLCDSGGQLCHLPTLQGPLSRLDSKASGVSGRKSLF